MIAVMARKVWNKGAARKVHEINAASLTRQNTPFPDPLKLKPKKRA
jgi:hypothetical protein